MDKKRILVAGGVGFIGSHLCEKLLQGPGNEVLCVDNLYSSSKSQGFERIRHYSNFEFLRHDITLPLFVEVDEIYNLATGKSMIGLSRTSTIRSGTIATLPRGSSLKYSEAQR